MRHVVALPRQADTASQRRREIVGVAFELDAERQRLVCVRLAFGDGRTRDETRSDGGCARPKAALERDPVDETELVVRRIGEERERAQREMPAVARQLGGALAVDLHPASVRPLLDVNFVPELERGSGAVEARAEVRR